MPFDDLPSKLKYCNVLNVFLAILLANISASFALLSCWTLKSIRNTLHGIAFSFLLVLSVVTAFVWSATMADIHILLHEPAFFDPITTNAINTVLSYANTAIAICACLSAFFCGLVTLIFDFKLGSNDDIIDLRTWFLLNATVMLNIACVLAMAASYGFDAKTMDVGNASAVERAEYGTWVATKLAACIVLSVTCLIWGFLASVGGMIVMVRRIVEGLWQARASAGDGDVELNLRR